MRGYWRRRGFKKQKCFLLHPLSAGQGIVITVGNDRFRNWVDVSSLHRNHWPITGKLLEFPSFRPEYVPRIGALTIPFIAWVGFKL